MAFEVGTNTLQLIHRRYSKLHPNLLPIEYENGSVSYDGEARVLEVFAYYEGDKRDGVADAGTRLRFLAGSGGAGGALPGIVSVNAEFGDVRPAYYDHAVSNGERIRRARIRSEFLVFASGVI